MGKIIPDLTTADGQKKLPVAVKNSRLGQQNLPGGGRKEVKKGSSWKTGVHNIFREGGGKLTAPLPRFTTEKGHNYTNIIDFPSWEITYSFIIINERIHFLSDQWQGTKPFNTIVGNYWYQ